MKKTNYTLHLNYTFSIYVEMAIIGEKNTNINMTTWPQIFECQYNAIKPPKLSHLTTSWLLLCRQYNLYTFYFSWCQGKTTKIWINCISIILWYPFAVCTLNKFPCLVEILHSWSRPQHFLTYFDTSFCMYEMCYSEHVYNIIISSISSLCHLPQSIYWIR